MLRISVEITRAFHRSRSGPRVGSGPVQKLASSRVGSGGVRTPTGRVGSGQEVIELHGPGTGWGDPVGSGREVIELHGPGTGWGDPVGSGREVIELHGPGTGWGDPVGSGQEVMEHHGPGRVILTPPGTRPVPRVIVRPVKNVGSMDVYVERQRQARFLRLWCVCKGRSVRR